MLSVRNGNHIGSLVAAALLRVGPGLLPCPGTHLRNTPRNPLHCDGGDSFHLSSYLSSKVFLFIPSDEMGESQSLDATQGRPGGFYLSGSRYM